MFETNTICFSIEFDKLGFENTVCFMESRLLRQDAGNNRVLRSVGWESDHYPGRPVRRTPDFGIVRAIVRTIPANQRKSRSCCFSPRSPEAQEETGTVQRPYFGVLGKASTYPRSAAELGTVLATFRVYSIPVCVCFDGRAGCKSDNDHADDVRQYRDQNKNDSQFAFEFHRPHLKMNLFRL